MGSACVLLRRRWIPIEHRGGRDSSRCRRTLPRCECAKPPIGGSWGANEAKSRRGAALASGYRALAGHPEWDAIARPQIPPSLIYVYDRNVDARRQLTAIVASALKDTLPAWRIEPPAPADELLGYYRKAEAATGVGWNYLAAINLVETGLGRIVGVSHAGAQGPRQFLPSTFAVYGDGARSSR